MPICRKVCHFRFSNKADFAKMAHTTILHLPGDLIFLMCYLVMKTKTSIFSPICVLYSEDSNILLNLCAIV